MRTPLVIVGAQWGDEGKGKVVNLLSSYFDVVARYQGGHNAGHTVKIGEDKYALHLVPSGILAEKKICVIGNGIALDPEALIDEMNKLKKARIDISYLRISDRCHLLLPHHALIDKLREEAKGKDKIGTTGRGIGPCYESKYSREGIRAVFLKDVRRLKQELKKICDEKNRIIKILYGNDGIDTKETIDRFVKYAKILSPYICDASILINDKMRQGKNVIIEGAQGTMLDIDHGTFPFVTSSSTVAGGASIGLGIPPHKIGSVYGVFKAYCTRVGQGPFPTEQQNAIGDMIRERGNEYGTTTGRPRRCGWFDLVAARHSVRINGLDGICIMLLDVLDTFEKIKICVGYKYRKEVYLDFPAEPWILEKAKPIYVEIKGWNKNTRGIRDFDFLPQNAKKYIEFIERELKTKVVLVSTGPERSETILRDSSLKRMIKL